MSLAVDKKIGALDPSYQSRNISFDVYRLDDAGNDESFPIYSSKDVILDGVFAAGEHFGEAKKSGDPEYDDIYSLDTITGPPKIKATIQKAHGFVIAYPARP